MSSPVDNQAPISAPTESCKDEKRKFNDSCSECRRAHKACDRGRPCGRCVQLGIAHKCVSSVRKKRSQSKKKWFTLSVTECDGTLKIKSSCDGGAVPVKVESPVAVKTEHYQQTCQVPSLPYQTQPVKNNYYAQHAQPIPYNHQGYNRCSTMQFTDETVLTQQLLLPQALPSISSLIPQSGYYQAPPISCSRTYSQPNSPRVNWSNLIDSRNSSIVDLLLRNKSNM
jgi:hypothetical protein